MAEKIIDYISGLEVNATPEEVEAVQPMARLLVEEYGYPKEHIQTHPQYRVKRAPSDKRKSYPVDIAVFDSENRDEASIKIIVECKQRDRKDGIDQLENYLNFSRATMGVWFNGDERVYRHKTERDGQTLFSEIPNIPRHGERLEDIGLYLRRDLIAPKNLKVAFRTIRNYLAGNAVGATRDEVFAQQIINIIFCKLYDERFTKQEDMVQFRAGINEHPSEVSARLRVLFDIVKSKYSEVLDDSDNLDLDHKTLAYIVGELQAFCLVDSERDVIAEAFETFIDHALKGGQGQFFTPRNVVKLMVTLADPSPSDLIIDPACGSGGFLVECLRYVWEKLDKKAKEFGWSEMSLHEDKAAFAMKNMFGLDKDRFLSKVAKAYMTLLGDGKGGIFCEDSLAVPSSWSAEARSHVHLEKYDVLLTNPPFGKEIQITGDEKLVQYDLAHDWHKSGSKSVMRDKLKSSVRPEVLFIERSLQFLKKGGVMGIVLPETFFHAPKSKHIMDFIKQHNIQWIVDLPHNTFRPHNNAKCIALIVQKNVEQKPVINLAVAEQMGHDHTGKDMFRYNMKEQRIDKSRLWDDIPIILEEVNAARREKYTFTKSAKQLADKHVYVPRYYWEAVDAKIEEEALNQGLEMVTLREMVQANAVTYFDGHGSPAAEHKGRGEKPYVRVKDIVNWEIYKDPTARVPDHVYNDMVSNKKRIAEGDVLFVRRGSYRIGSVAIASPYDDECLLTREILVLRTEREGKWQGITSYYLLWLLSHSLVQMQIPNKVLIETTLPNIGSRWLDLKLPIHKDVKVRLSVGGHVERAVKAKWEALDLMAGLMREHGALTT